MIDKVINLFDEEKMKKVQQAQQEMRAFLDGLSEDRKKELLEFQEQLEIKLKKAGNSQNRLMMLQALMREKLSELSEQLKSLSNSLTHFTGDKDE